MGCGEEDPTVTSRVFGYLSGGEAVTEYTLTNRSSMIVKVIDYGGIITELHVADRDGTLADVVLGFDDLRLYEERHPYFGAIIGRVAGRISGGNLVVDDVRYQLPLNNGRNHLHGGVNGFDRVLWTVTSSSTDAEITLRYVSLEGEEGYPGTLSVQVRYALTDDNELRVDYFAATDRATVVNLTQHTYFNLSGDPQSSVLDHWLAVHANRYLEINEDSVPTGSLLPVSGTPFDFRKTKQVGQHLHENHAQLVFGKGYDHFWVLDKDAFAGQAKLAAVLADAKTGRQMEVYTTSPGVQIYSANYLKKSVRGKQGRSYGPRRAICLETQGYPDAPNRPEFPSTLLNPGDEFHSRTVFRFRKQQLAPPGNS